MWLETEQYTVCSLVCGYKYAWMPCMTSLGCSSFILSFITCMAAIFSSLKIGKVWSYFSPSGFVDYFLCIGYKI